MSTQDIEARLRTLAAKFSGVAMGHRLPKNDHGAARDIEVRFLDNQGVSQAVSDELLDIADAIAMQGLPKVVGKS